MRNLIKKTLTILICLSFSTGAYSISQSGSNSRDKFGFDAESIDTWMSEGVMKEKVKVDLPAIFKKAVSFRQGMLEDIPKTIERHSKKSSDFNVITQSVGYEKLPQIWNYFFSTSLVLVGNAMSSTPIVAYYNPFLDSVVYVQWKVEGNNIMAEKMSLNSFETTGENQISQVKWVEKGGSPADLLKGYQEFKDGFERDYEFKSTLDATVPFIKNQDYKKEVLEARSLKALLEIGAIFNKKSKNNIKEAWVSLSGALQETDKIKLEDLIPKENVMSVQKVLEIPFKLRSRLAPVFVLIKKDQTHLYQQVDGAPKFSAILSVKNAEDEGKNVINEFMFFSMETVVR